MANLKMNKTKLYGFIVSRGIELPPKSEMYFSKVSRSSSYFLRGIESKVCFSIAGGRAFFIINDGPTNPVSYEELEEYGLLQN